MLDLCNFDLNRMERFGPFEVYGYRFQPKDTRHRRPPAYEPRGMYTNASVKVPKRQRDSVIFLGGRDLTNRKRKLIEDMMVIASLLVGHNVELKSHSGWREFPLCRGKHLKQVAYDWNDFRIALETATARLLEPEWKRLYENGFHIRMLYCYSDTTTAELRFLGYCAIWEFLYYCNNRIVSYKKLTDTSLQAKLCYLVSRYLLEHGMRVSHDALRVFCDMRNQFAHSGKLPILNPKSPYRSLTWEECREEIGVFEGLTQALVLKTLAVDLQNCSIGMLAANRLIKN